MESNLDRSLVEELLAAPGLMRQCLLHALTTPVEVLEFRTRDEGLCDARLYHCGKAQAATPAEGLIALLNRELHQVEEWALEETTPEHVGDLMERWLLPELANAQPTGVDIDKATLEITSLGDTIRSAILARHADTGRPYHGGRWGIFRDGQPQPLDTPILSEPLIAPALALQDSWNEKLYFCETHDTWLLYSWATGA